MQEDGSTLSCLFQRLDELDEDVTEERYERPDRYQNSDILRMEFWITYDKYTPLRWSALYV
jgi:hypothetical protein